MAIYNDHGIEMSSHLKAHWLPKGLSPQFGIRDLSGNNHHLATPHALATNFNNVQQFQGMGWNPSSNSKPCCVDYTEIVDDLHLTKPGRSWFAHFEMYCNEEPMRTTGANALFNCAGSNVEHYNEPSDPGGTFGFNAVIVWDVSGMYLQVYTDGNDAARIKKGSYVTATKVWHKYFIYYDGANNEVSIYTNSNTPDIDAEYLWVGERTDAPFQFGGNGLKFNEDYPTTGVWSGTAYYEILRNIQIYTVDDLNPAGGDTLKTTIESTYIPWLLANPVKAIPAEIWP